jgi:transposase
MNGYGIRYLYPKMPLMHSCIKSRWVAEKMLWVTASQEGKSITEIAQSAKVSRNTIYKWLGRFKEGGINNLSPQIPGARTGTHPSRINNLTVIRIIELFEEEGFGLRSIVHQLLKEGVNISHMTAYRYLVRRGRIIPHHCRRRKIAKLHVCDFPGEEVQLDVMHINPLPGTEDQLGRKRLGFHYQYTLVDDCSRTQYARLFPNLSQDNSCLFLEEIIDKSPFPLNRVRMDNGAENQSKVRSFLEKRHISYVYNQPSRPDMNGKVERTHRIDTEEFYLKDNSKSFEERQIGLNKYVCFFNNERPHWGLGMDGKTPLEKLKSFKEYQTVNLIV